MPSKWTVTGYGFGVYSVHRSAKSAWYEADHSRRLARRIGDIDRRITVTLVFGGRGYWSYTLTVIPKDERIKKVCAWCKVHMAGDYDAPLVSHGICPRCLRTFENEEATRGH